MWPASRGVLAGPDPDGQCGQAAVLHFLDCQVHDPPGRRARCGLASSSGQPSGGMFSIAPTVRTASNSRTWDKSRSATYSSRPRHCAELALGVWLPMVTRCGLTQTVARQGRHFSEPVVFR